MEAADTGASGWNPPVMAALCSPTLTLIFSFPSTIHGMNFGGTRVMSKLYPNGCAKYPVADLQIYCELVSGPKSYFTHANIIQ